MFFHSTGSISSSNSWHEQLHSKSVEVSFDLTVVKTESRSLNEYPKKQNYSQWTTSIETLQSDAQMTCLYSWKPFYLARVLTILLKEKLYSCYAGTDKGFGGGGRLQPNDLGIQK
jgi:hypothetical protein